MIRFRRFDNYILPQTEWFKNLKQWVLVSQYIFITLIRISDIILSHVKEFILQ